MGALALLGGFRGVLAALSGAGLMFLALASYDRLIDDPVVSREARAGFVALSEKVALEARLSEETRQRLAVAAVGAEFSRRRLIAEAIAASRIETLEQEIAGNEAKLLERDRLCRLDDADIEFLRKP